MGTTRNYCYACEFDEKTTLETVEAHIANVAKLLDKQANETLDDDDDDTDTDTGDAWKRPPSPDKPPAGQTPA